MKITRLEATVIAVPYDHGGARPPGDGRAWTRMETLFLKVETDEGIVGWGEGFGFSACAVTKRAIDDLVAPFVVGKDASDVHALMAEVKKKLHNAGRDGPVMFAISALDVALWDIAGKAAGQPIWRMLGGDAPETLPVYASLLRYSDPENVARNATAAIERGYREIKLHEIGLAEVRAARAAIGPDIPLTLDTNCAWPAAEAVEMAKQLAECDLLWLEEPVYPADDFAGLARVKREGGIPVAAGENIGTFHDFERFIDMAEPDYVQPSINKLGGISAFLDVAQLADERGVEIAPHSPYFGPGLIATIHVLAARKGRQVVERFYCDLEASPLGDAILAVDGQFVVPRGPGLGITVDEKLIQRYRVG